MESKKLSDLPGQRLAISVGGEQVSGCLHHYNPKSKIFSLVSTSSGPHTNLLSTGYTHNCTIYLFKSGNVDEIAYLDNCNRNQGLPEEVKFRKQANVPYEITPTQLEAQIRTNYAKTSYLKEEWQFVRNIQRLPISSQFIANYLYKKIGHVWLDAENSIVFSSSLKLKHPYKIEDLVVINASGNSNANVKVLLKEAWDQFESQKKGG
ncbi:hypothetical protein DAMA08_019930 [Martiniozyma asiatica (nom. inval.)]|nr:hypothetical protein DAMA08_019930 [Martiniozyma asiatica]